MGGTVVWDESSPWHEDTFYSASLTGDNPAFRKKSLRTLTPPELLAEIE